MQTRGTATTPHRLYSDPDDEGPVRMLVSPAWVGIRDHIRKPHAQLDPAGPMNMEVISLVRTP